MIVLLAKMKIFGLVVMLGVPAMGATIARHPAQKALLDVIRDEDFEDTLEEIQKKYTQAKKRIRRLGRGRRIDTSSLTETCPGLEGTITLGEEGQRSRWRKVFEAELKNGAADSKKVEVTYTSRCKHEKEDYVEYVFAGIASEIGASPKVLCLSPILESTVTPVKKIPQEIASDKQTENCKRVQFIVSEPTGPLVAGFVEKESPLLPERFKGVLSFGIHLIGLLKKLHEKGILHNKVNEDNVAFAFNEDNAYGFSDDAKVVLKNYDHAVFYPDSDVVWGSAMLAYASPWVLAASKQGEIRPGTRDDVYCAVELIANILSKNGMRKAFNHADFATLEIIKGSTHLFDKDPKLGEDGDMLWGNIYKMHAITNQEKIRQIEGKFQEMMEEIQDMTEDDEPPYQTIIEYLTDVKSMIDSP